MKQIYDIELENKLFDGKMLIAEMTYNVYEICAKRLGITVEEYIDFTIDMQIETAEYTLEEIEGMYVEYCQEYEIPCMQIDIGVPMKLYGAI